MRQLVKHVECLQCTNLAGKPFSANGPDLCINKESLMYLILLKHNEHWGNTSSFQNDMTGHWGLSPPQNITWRLRNFIFLLSILCTVWFKLISHYSSHKSIIRPISHPNDHDPWTEYQMNILWFYLCRSRPLRQIPFKWPISLMII
jgi:hypothetical protein